MTPPADPVAEIKRLYYATTKQTIVRDLARAIDLLKQLPSRRGARARRRLHGRPGADAIGVGRQAARRPRAAPAAAAAPPRGAQR